MQNVNNNNKIDESISCNDLIENIKNLAMYKNVENFTKCKNLNKKKIIKKLAEFGKIKFIAKNIKILKNLNFLIFDTRLVFTKLR